MRNRIIPLFRAPPRVFGPLRRALILMALCGFVPVETEAAREKTLPVERIRPGQKGYGLSVFSGFRIERFDVEVIDILRNFLPKQDLIIMRGHHPVLARAGVVAGMSGSPIYLDGKLVGALAYGWRFSKEVIFGVTPIANMLQMTKRRRLGRQRAGELVARAIDRDLSAPPLGRASYRLRDALSKKALDIVRQSERWWRLPFRKRRTIAANTTFQALSVPLSIAGLSEGTAQELGRAFEDFGFKTVQGGGTGHVEGPKRFERGAAIGVQLVRGDVSMSGTGTVTWSDGKNVLGFGHPMFNAGELYLPAISAKIHHVLASSERSFKLSSPARALGSLVFDRQPGIMARQGLHAGMVPVTITLKAANTNTRYRVEVAKHRLLTPNLVGSVVSSAISEAISDVAGGSYDIALRFALIGHPTVTVRDQGYAHSGLRLSGLMGSRGFQALSLALTNPFAPVDLERIDIALTMRHGEHPIVITQTRIPSNEIKPGAKLPVTVSFRQYDGSEFDQTYTIPIPKTLGGSVLALNISSGRSAKPELAAPRNLKELLGQLPKHYSARSLVFTLRLPTEGAHIRGHVIRDLPPSMIDTFRSASASADTVISKTIVRKHFGTRRLIIGKKEVRLHVKDEHEQ